MESVAYDKRVSKSAQCLCDPVWQRADNLKIKSSRIIFFDHLGIVDIYLSPVFSFLVIVDVVVVDAVVVVVVDFLFFVVVVAVDVFVVAVVPFLMCLFVHSLYYLFPCFFSSRFSSRILSDWTVNRCLGDSHLHCHPANDTG